MVLHHGQDIFQIAEGIQVIRLCCFCNAVDDRTGFRAVDAVDQLLCMFVQAEAAQRPFTELFTYEDNSVKMRSARLRLAGRIGCSAILLPELMPVQWSTQWSRWQRRMT